MSDNQILKDAVELAKLAARLMVVTLLFGATVITTQTISSCNRSCPTAEKP